MNTIETHENNLEKDHIEASHAAMVRALVKPGEAIKEELTPSDCDLVHLALGVAGEVGELIDAIKKMTIYRKPLDRENAVEELGDLEFFLEAIRDNLGISRIETLQHNRAKLSRRYATGKYSNKHATDRADKA